ncbi:hypothetical protein FRC01_005972 [Tulasnella sp. 417]|nr:hypothetical protein FRC01_005972 [Tulasnella sp. 417]
MPPSRSSTSSNVVFFTYKRRKVALARPVTYEEALNLAKKTFTALKAIPSEKLCISACLPDHEEEGVVEIGPEAWKLVTSGVKQFTVGVLEEVEKVKERGKVKGHGGRGGSQGASSSGPHVLNSTRCIHPLEGPTQSGYVKIQPETQDLWVIVKTMTGREDRFRGLHPSDDICTLKRQIHALLGMPVDQQSLLFGWKHLEDDRTLAYYSIKSGAVLRVVQIFRGGKPVIYLYPPVQTNAKVRLSLVPQWSLSAVYPQPIKGTFKEGESSRTAEWDVVAQPSGMMAVKGSSTEVAYIFWEAETESHNHLPESPPISRSSTPLLGAGPGTMHPRVGFVPGTTKCSPHDSVVLSLQDVPPYLEKTLLALGLHTEARTSFITLGLGPQRSYWLPSFLKHEFLALRFIPQVDYEASAPLDFDPKPDVVTRVFMLFEGVPTDRLAEWEEARQRSSADVNMWKGIVGVEDTRQRDQNLFRVLEWGGMEVR